MPQVDVVEVQEIVTQKPAFIREFYSLFGFADAPALITVNLVGVTDDGHVDSNAKGLQIRIQDKLAQGEPTIMQTQPVEGGEEGQTEEVEVPNPSYIPNGSEVTLQGQTSFVPNVTLAQDLNDMWANAIQNHPKATAYGATGMTNIQMADHLFNIIGGMMQPQE